MKKILCILLFALSLSSCYTIKRGCPDTWSMGGYTKTNKHINQQNTK